MKRFSSIILIAIVGILIMGSCRSKKEVAQQAETTIITPWLDEMLPALSERHSTITRYEMDGKPYYAVFVKGPDRSYDMNRTTIYDSEGNVYLSLGGPRQRSEKELKFFENSVSHGVIWQSDSARQANEE